MELIEYTKDTFSGLETFTHLDGDLMHTTYKQDIEQNIEMTRAMRNDDDYWRQGVKNGFVHVAHIPNVTVSELLKIGVNVYRAPVKEIISGLYKIHKEHLITTRKNVC
jgi:hypothetical protein